MPAIQRSEFALALNQVATERGVDASVVLDTVKNAILAAYRKDHPGIEVEEYSATLNSNTGEARIFHQETDVTPPGFGRIAAQTAKQVILQKIREKEKDAILTVYRGKLGTIVNGIVLRFAGPNIIVDIGKTEAIMPPQEQMAGEKYHLNQRITVLILDIREGLKGEEIIVSRANEGLLRGLLTREVPELQQKTVEIRAVAREAGHRAKVAVYSTQHGVDPVGSCVGQKGVRIQAVIQELGGIEKIDIIQWQDDLSSYIRQALSPAKEMDIDLKADEKVAYVYIPKEELSLAIGKEGQNVRLASKLTGYRIEIEEKVGAKKEEVEEPKEKVVEVAKAKEEKKKEKETEEKKVEKTAKEPEKQEETESVAEDSSIEPIQEVSEADPVAQVVETPAQKVKSEEKPTGNDES